MATSVVCSVPNCDKPKRARGWCNQHYQRWKKHGDPLTTTHYEGALCSLDGCSGKARARGLCIKHWRRLMIYGDPTLHIRASKGEPLEFLQNVVLPHRSGDCLIWPFDRSPSGYARINMLDDGTRIVSRIVCEAINGPPPSSKHEAAHSCGKGHLGCVNPQHLRWATTSENSLDKIIHGTIIRGEDCNLSVLSEDDVRAIRRLKGTMFQREIAALYNVSRPTISMILSRKTWQWIE